MQKFGEKLTKNFGIAFLVPNNSAMLASSVEYLFVFQFRLNINFLKLTEYQKGWEVLGSIAALNIFAKIFSNKNVSN